MSDAKMVAVTCSALTYIVDLLLALIRTTEVGTNPVPVTVSVKLGLPAVTTEGLMLVIVGATCAFACVHIPTTITRNSMKERRPGRYRR
jgi:hypothetical protein